MTLLSTAISRGPATPTDPAVARPAPETPGISANLPVYRHPGNTSTMVQPMALTPNERGEEECAGDFNQRDSLSESEIMKHEAAENRKYVYHGEISPAMRVRLERGTAPEIIPRHHLHKDCKSCRNCPICYKAAPGFFIKLATKTFQHAPGRTEFRLSQPIKQPPPSLWRFWSWWR